MSDTKIFRVGESTAELLPKTNIALEKDIQTIFENNLETMLGVRLLASEFSTSHGGRMDTLGIDEDNCPVIIEYKRSKSENIVNQGLFYLDWLMDHRGEFEILVRDQIGKNVATNIGWTAPRLVCIANEFSKYDEHAVKQINRNIELVRFQKFDSGILLVELLTAQSAKTSPSIGGNTGSASSSKTVSQYLQQSDEGLRGLFERARDSLLLLGEDVQEKTLKNYFAFKRIKNFACLEIKPTERKLLVYLKIDPSSTHHEEGFSRDVRKIGHFGTGDFELTIRTDSDLEKALPFFQESYDNS